MNIPVDRRPCGHTRILSLLRARRAAMATLRTEGSKVGPSFCGMKSIVAIITLIAILTIAPMITTNT